MENELFDEMYKVESRHWWFVARRKIIGNVIEQLRLEKNSSILDAGCGNGDNLEMLSRYGDVMAMEREENALQKAQARNIGNVFKGELPSHIHADIQKDKDLIVLLDVLEHIDDDAGSLEALGNYMNDNGSLVLTVPAYQFLWTSHDEQHHHKRRYTVTQLKTLIENNGWNVSYISYFNTLLFPLALIDRIKQKWFSSGENEGLKMPSTCINAIFEKIFSFESRFIGKIAFPFGLSIIAVAKKT
ncbi:MAG: class I SAM-dependent methyltransferase [Proteobacteria bacterium]|nr:class I SAM-dependent methyltransferase [Pseudomonadota bacterium]NOG60128.1 class I SAM-dependent methyltransferase [Pseudomonadota bacterium]